MRFTVLVFVLFVIVVCPMAANPTSCVAGGQNKITDDVKLVQGKITHRYHHRVGTAAGTDMGPMDPGAGGEADTNVHLNVSFNELEGTFKPSAIEEEENAATVGASSNINQMKAQSEESGDVCRPSSELMEEFRQFPEPNQTYCVCLELYMDTTSVASDYVSVALGDNGEIQRKNAPLKCIYRGHMSHDASTTVVVDMCSDPWEGDFNDHGSTFQMQVLSTNETMGDAKGGRVCIAARFKEILPPDDSEEEVQDEDEADADQTKDFNLTNGLLQQDGLLQGQGARMNLTVQNNLPRCSWDCYGAGWDKGSRDASCAAGLVCAREGEDGRSFGCLGYHCCSKVQLPLGSTACWGAGSGTDSRDASCAANLVCARNGEDGRGFGCHGYHCCSERGGLQVGSTACWGAGSDTNSRDASCADGLVCARNGEDGRNFGCQGYHCCFENSKFSRWRIIPRDETWRFSVKELKIQARDGISGRPIASGNGNYLAAFDYDPATFWKGEGDARPWIGIDFEMPVTVSTISINQDDFEDLVVEGFSDFRNTWVAVKSAKVNTGSAEQSLLGDTPCAPSAEWGRGTTRLNVLVVADFDAYRDAKRGNYHDPRGHVEYWSNRAISDLNTWYADTRFSFGQLQFQMVGLVVIESLDVTRAALQEYANSKNEQWLKDLYTDREGSGKMLDRLYFFKSQMARNALQAWNYNYDFMLVWSKGNGGWAASRTACKDTWNSVSIINGINAGIAKHELGHLIGATHDNNCPDCNKQFVNTNSCPDCGNKRAMGGNQKHLFSTFSTERIEAWWNWQGGKCRR